MPVFQLVQGDVPYEGAFTVLTFSGHWGDDSWQNQMSQFPLMLAQESPGLSSDSHSRKMLFRNQDVDIRYANHCWSSIASLPIGWTQLYAYTSHSDIQRAALLLP